MARPVRTDWSGVRIYTIGHSTRTLDELVALLRTFDVSTLVDVRTIPRSRHNPQFNGDALRAELPERGLRYEHLPQLGGLRRAHKDSPNLGWHNASFRGFADYMSTDAFEAGLASLHLLAAKSTVSLMCAEAVPWRCHRSLVADALTVRGAHVEHITSAARTLPHRLTAFAHVDGARVTYPAAPLEGSPLATQAPFHLEATVRVLQRRPANLIDVWEKDRYRRLFATPEGLVLVEVENRGTIDDPDVRFSVLSGAPSQAARVGLEHTLRRVLGLDVDPTRLLRLAGTDRRLRPTALALRGMRPPRFTGLFETFVNVVPFQQLSLDAGVAIVGRIVERFGEQLDWNGRRFYAFPTAGTVAGGRQQALRRCGLSARKANVLRHLARLIDSGELSETAFAGVDTSDALRLLTRLPGIGAWSASVTLLRGLGRLDVFPPGDVGATRGLRVAMGLRAEASLDDIIERFGDRRGYLYFHALGGSLLAKGLIHASPSVTRGLDMRPAHSRV